MRVPDLLRSHPLALGAMLGAMLGVVIGLFLPIRAPEAKPAQDPKWDLPTLASARSYTDAAASGARSATYWGDQSQAAKRGVQRATWTLKAIATRPIPRIAIAQGSRNEISWVDLGGALPDGSVLVTLDRDTAWVERDGCRSPRPLYARSSDPVDDPCASLAATSDAPSPPRKNSQKTDTQ